MDKKNIQIKSENRHIWTINNSSENAFLLKKVPEFRYEEYERKDIEALVKHMRRMMTTARGVGLSANQIGFPFRLFVAQLPTKDGRGYSGKFYAIINPVISRFSAKKTQDQEGCLSVPYVYGTVDRPDKITIEGVDKNGRSVLIKADGFLARIFQHETDHLNGILFTGKAYDLIKVASEKQIL